MFVEFSEKRRLIGYTLHQMILSANAQICYACSDFKGTAENVGSIASDQQLSLSKRGSVPTVTMKNTDT